MINWIFWSVPPEHVRRYLLTMWLVMFIIPGYIFGLHLTKLGFIINLLWYDLVFYGWVRFKQRMEGDEQ
jgi:hypothetical protein